MRGFGLRVKISERRVSARDERRREKEATQKSKARDSIYVGPEDDAGPVEMVYVCVGPEDFCRTRGWEEGGERRWPPVAEAPPGASASLERSVSARRVVSAGVVFCCVTRRRSSPSW